jgi:murein L,D-transpeptidase YafK
MKKLLLICILAAAITFIAWANWPASRLPAGTTGDRIVIEKAERTLTLYRKGTALKAYQVSLGRVPVGAKEKEGDRKTPEGLYRIIEHKRASRFHRALRISYPEAKDIQYAQSHGVNPGSDIMIHGIQNGVGLIGRAHRWFDWTAGCIAITNPEIDELFDAVTDGTEVEIRK